MRYVAYMLTILIFSGAGFPGDKKFATPEELATQVLESLQKNKFSLYTEVYGDAKELKEVLKEKEWSDKGIKERVEEYESVLTTEYLQEQFDNLIKAPESEGAYWNELTLKKNVIRVDENSYPVSAEIRIVVSYRNLEFVVICSQCYLTKNGWKTFANPVFVSIQEQQKDFEIWKQQNESER